MSSNAAKLLSALVLFAVAAVLAVRFWADDGGVSDKAFFYDLSEGKLFVAPRTAVPPIRGLNDDQEDAVRAVVISTNGKPHDKRSRTIAYLEMYSAELKKQFEAAQAGGSSPAMGRGAAQFHRLVRRLNDKQWHPMASPEGEKIVGEWLTAGVDGTPAVICAP